MKIFLSHNIGVRYYATKNLKKVETTVESTPKLSLLTKIRNSNALIKSKIKSSETLSSLKLLRLSYNNFKINLTKFIYSILSTFGIARIVNPFTLTLFIFIKVTLKWLFRALSLFNIVLIIWIFYFNTPIITAKLILGWLGDFFRVGWTTYTNSIAKFFDYINKVLEHGFKSVPSQNPKPIEYPNYGFIKEYRELFRKLSELTPISSEYQPRRWYDSLRDHYIDRTPTNPFFPSNPSNPTNPFNGGDTPSYFNGLYNVYQFMRDYWYVGAIISTCIVTGGALFFYWDPISTTFISTGESIKQVYLDCIQYFSTRPSTPDSGGDTPIEVVDLTSSPDTPDLESLARRFPNVPNTSVWGDSTSSSGASTPTGGGSITPTGGGSITPKGASTSHLNINIPSINIPSGSNPWNNPSPVVSNTVSNSPVLDKLGHLNPDIFKAPEVNSNVHNATDALIKNASGPRTFPIDFDKK